MLGIANSEPQALRVIISLKDICAYEIERAHLPSLRYTGTYYDKQFVYMKINVGGSMITTEKVPFIQDGETKVNDIKVVLEESIVKKDGIISVELFFISTIDVTTYIGKCVYKINSCIPFRMRSIPINFEIAPSSNTTRKVVKGIVRMNGLITPDLTSIPVEDNSPKLRLTLDLLSCKDVYDTGSILNTQDLALIITVGLVSVRTKRVINCGVNCTFEDQVSLLVKESNLYSGEDIIIEVVNENALGVDTHVGIGKLSLTQEMPEQMKRISMKLFLTNETNSINKGIVLLRGIFSHPDVNLEPEPEYKLTIENISCKDVYDSGTFFDKQDLAINIKVSNLITFKTERMQDCGTQASFKESFDIIFKESVLTLREEVHLDVVNRDAKGKETHIGTVKFVIADMLLVKNKNTRTPLKFELYNSFVFAMCGSISFTGILSDPLYNIQPDTPLKLILTEMSCKDVYDSGNFLDKQDLAITITVGSDVFKSDRVCDCGTKAKFAETFNVICKETVVNAGQEILIEIVNVNALGLRTHVGRGKAIIYEACPDYFERFQFTVDLYNETKKIEMGTCTITAILADDIEYFEPEIKLLINGLKCEDVYDTGSFYDAQDLAYNIIIGDEVLRTERMTDAGVTSSFPENFTITLKEIFYSTGQEITIEIVNKGSLGGETHVGIGKFVLWDSVPVQYERTLVTVDLYNNTKSFLKGTASMYVMISDPAIIEPKLTISLDRFHCKDVFDTGSFLDKQDLAIQITIGSEILKSERICDCGTEAKFPEKYDVIVDESFISSGQEMTLEIVNKSLIGATTHVGIGSIIIKDFIYDYNKRIFGSINLINETNKIDKGVVTFRGFIFNPYQIKEDDKDFKLVIRSIQCKDVYDTGSFWDKQDLACVITLGDQEFNTERICDSGVNASFPEVYEIILKESFINELNDIEIEIVNKSITGSKTHCGRCTLCLATIIPISEYHYPVNLTFPLTYEVKNQLKGNVYLSATLIPL